MCNICSYIYNHRAWKTETIDAEQPFTCKPITAYHDADALYWVGWLAGGGAEDRRVSPRLLERTFVPQRAGVVLCVCLHRLWLFPSVRTVSVSASSRGIDVAISVTLCAHAHPSGKFVGHILRSSISSRRRRRRR